MVIYFSLKSGTCLFNAEEKEKKMGNKFDKYLKKLYERGLFFFPFLIFIHFILKK